MEFITRSQKRKIIITTFIYLFLILIAAQLLYIRKVANMTPIYVVNVSVDIFGMIMGYVLFICCLIDVQKTGANYFYFFLLLNATYFGLFTDACAWLMDGIPKYRWLNVADNTLYYMCAPIAAYFFWRFVKSRIKSARPLMRIFEIIIRVGLAVSLALIVANLFLHFYFNVDEAGIYHRTAFYSITLICPMFTMLATLGLVVLERKQLSRYQQVAVLVYVAAPLVSSIMTMNVYGLSISFAMNMMVMLLMYCVLNVTQGREKAIADRDLTVAAAIQENMLPNRFPAFPDRKEFDLYATMTPAKEVGGDFYDFFMVDDDHLALVMADVSGKGVPAALFMMVSKMLIKNRVQTGESPGKALVNVNNQLIEGNRAEMFVTVWLAVLEISTGKGVAANAGHEHPVLKRADGQYELIKYRHSPAVATIEEIPFREHEFELHAGDTLFVYTDGVPEASDAQEELFGTDRMLEALNSEPDAGPEKVLENVMNGITEFVAGAKQFDDITMLCFRYNGIPVA
ncbi:MAG: PP2C family protein-serine/threonine phosphatase [Lachnospiraceae bacterium]|nr:PP2C family protein-serine/threonine phosphatase [Lachnospiraceae bacterium]